MLKETSEPPLAGCDVALLASAAFRKPCGVVQISIVRSSTAAGCACGTGDEPGCAPPGAARFQAYVPLIICTARCSTGAGRDRPGSMVCLRAISTRALGAS